MERPKGAQDTGCSKPGCNAIGWWISDNDVEFGEQILCESWSAWCPVHGGYGAQGMSPIVWFDELPDQAEEKWAAYCGFTGPNAVEMWRRAVGQ